MKITLTREQLSGAKMVGGKRKKIELTIDGKIIQLGHTKLCKNTKRLIVDEYPHLVVHNASTYNVYSCRCTVCQAAQSVRNKLYDDERHSINKMNLLIRIADDLGLAYGEDVCKLCGADQNLETDHTDSNNKLMEIDSFQGYLNKPKLQDFITAEIGKCQILCKSCHAKSYRFDLITGRARNRKLTPWLKRKINGKRNNWTPTQIIPLLKQLNFKPGDKPRRLSKEEWQEYRDYADSIGKPSIPYTNTSTSSDSAE